jgi:glucose-6-phosphate-specific signal transduction histidine kinase
LAYTPQGLMITVENRSGAPTGPRTGHGLTGMSERAASVGGTLHAGADGGGRFEVRAFLPAPAGQDAAP